MSNDSTTISDGDMIILQKGSFHKKVKITKSRNFSFGKRGEGQFNVLLDGAVGHPFNSSFKMVLQSQKPKQKLYHLEKIENKTNGIDSVKAATDLNSGLDNRNLVDDGSSQKLSKEDIKQLVVSGASSNEVVQSLTENSSTFHAKTKYSQEKWMNKKQKKYDEVVTICKPSIRLVAKMYYAQDPLRIANLRIDTLSQILSYANVQSGGNFAIFESGTLGLVTSAALHRMGEEGSIIHLYQGQHPMREIIDCLDFPYPQLKVISYLNANKLAEVKVVKEELVEDMVIDESPKEAIAVKIEDSIPPTEENVAIPVKMEDSIPPTEENVAITVKMEDSIPSTEENVNNPKRKPKFVRCKDEDIALSMKRLQVGLHGMIVACKQYPKDVTTLLFKHLLPGHSFVIYSPYKELLVDLYDDMQALGGVNMRLCETWLRGYQVLPNRTHPEINMSGGGGYILYGFKILV